MNLLSRKIDTFAHEAVTFFRYRISAMRVQMMIQKVASSTTVKKAVMKAI